MFTAPLLADAGTDVEFATAAVLDAENRVARQSALLRDVEAKGYPEALKARELLAVMTENLLLVHRHRN